MRDQLFKENSRKLVVYVMLLLIGCFLLYSFIRLSIFAFHVSTLQARMRSYIYPGALLDHVPSEFSSSMKPLRENQHTKKIRELMNGEQAIYKLEKGHMIFYITTETTSNTTIISRVLEVRS